MLVANDDGGCDVKRTSRAAKDRLHQRRVTVNLVVNMENSVR
jgi:hypothetical protein